MSLQTELQAAVDKAQAASGKLHDVVNGEPRGESEMTDGDMCPNEAEFDKKRGF